MLKVRSLLQKKLPWQMAERMQSTHCLYWYCKLDIGPSNNPMKTDNHLKESRHGDCFLKHASWVVAQVQHIARHMTISLSC